MQIEFYKYQGAGNDFIMIDDRELQFPVSTELVNHLCDRRFGIGADGLILLRNYPNFDFEMVYFNSDGKLASMCGNGGRCTAAFAKQLGIKEEEYYFMAVDGEHRAFIKDKLVSLQMKNVNQISKRGSDIVLDTGSPHYIRFVDKLKDLDVVKLAKEIRNNQEFKGNGINVNFVSKDNTSANHISLRTYERGVEDETLACGTGVVASALAYFQESDDPKDKASSHHVFVSAMGGELEVDFDYDPQNLYNNIWLTGPAERVFEGEYKL